MRRLLLAAAAVVALTVSVAPSPASATYIGAEGKIAFVRANQVYSVAKTGGIVKQLTTSGKNYRPKWSPDGKRIAYLNEATGGAKDVWVMSATGSGKTKVTQSGTVTTNPTWSPDGQRLAFGQTTVTDECDPPFVCTRDQLYTIKSTAPFGSPVAAMGWVNEPWSDPDPSDIRPIEVDRFLAWSPDGTKIALYGHIDGHDDDTISMFYLNTGENREELATGSDGSGYNEWSDITFGPNGSLGYSQVDQGCCFDEQIEKLVYPAFVAVLGDKSPAPSPTNAHMAFVNASSGTPKILTSTITGKQRKVIVTNGYQPDWQSLH